MENWYPWKLSKRVEAIFDSRAISKKMYHDKRLTLLTECNTYNTYNT